MTLTAMPAMAMKKGGAVVTPRPRGRPKGSRNKPKAPLSGIREIPNTPKCHAFEIPSGVDVGKTLETFARRHQLGVFILSGTGMVSNVTLRRPAAPAGMVTYAGPLQIISLSGAFLHNTENQEATGMTVCLADVQGVIVAGSVVGSLVAFGHVFVMAGTVVDIHCEQPNVQPMQVQPRGLFQSSDRTEAQKQMRSAHFRQTTWLPFRQSTGPI
jgi:predicted DNA-binding protein with PD1-like motif